MNIIMILWHCTMALISLWVLFLPDIVEFYELWCFYEWYVVIHVLWLYVKIRVIWECIWMNVNYFNPTNDDGGGGGWCSLSFVYNFFILLQSFKKRNPTSLPSFTMYYLNKKPSSIVWVILHSFGRMILPSY